MLYVATPNRMSLHAHTADEVDGAVLNPQRVQYM